MQEAFRKVIELEMQQANSGKAAPFTRSAAARGTRLSGLSGGADGALLGFYKGGPEPQVVGYYRRHET